MWLSRRKENQSQAEKEHKESREKEITIFTAEFPEKP